MSTWIPQVPVTLSLRRLFPSASFVGCADIQVREVSERSSDCRPNVLFAAIPGTHVDGIEYVNEAVERGASAVLVERPLPDVATPQCVLPNTRRAYAQLCAALAGHPSCRLKIAGVTGTNGKTTVTWLVRSIMRAAGHQAGLLGTIEYADGTATERANLTTPDSKTLSDQLSQMVQQGTEHAAIEISSHALDQDRTAGTLLDVAVVTNVTQDHFDYHHNYKAYLAAKSRILVHRKPGALTVLNADDRGSISLRDQLSAHANVLTIGLNQPADVTARILDQSLSGSRFVLSYGLDADQVEVSTWLVGRHNVLNCLAAAAVARHFDVSLADIAMGIESLNAVPGRMERVDCGQPYDVFIDYAHTDDALRRAIDQLRSLTDGRVLCVFGAGGDRDRSKRVLLAKAAAGADLPIVTSDNPRTEDPRKIIGDILVGFDSMAKPPYIEIDRAQAIRWALDHAQPADSVLVAGKGHECEQIIGTQYFPFDDREVIREALAQQALQLMQRERQHAEATAIRS